MKKYYFFLITIFAISVAFWAGMTWKTYSSVSIRILEDKIKTTEFFHYQLSDGSEFARGIIERIATSSFYLRTSDELVPITTSGFTKIYTASYPLGNEQVLKPGNLNNVHNNDKVDVVFTIIDKRKEAINIIVWTNLRKQQFK